MAQTASEILKETRTRNVLVGTGTLAGGYYAFKQNKKLLGIVIFALAGGLAGSIVNKVYQNIK